jgi:hypothetical protein
LPQVRQVMGAISNCTIQMPYFPGQKSVLQ